MNITFANKKLEKYANNDRLAVRKLGKRRAELFKRRLDELLAAENYTDLHFLAGNYHILKNNRKGQWSCDLDQPYRLVFQPTEKPIPTNKDGLYILIEITKVDIIEIINYHKER